MNMFVNVYAESFREKAIYTAIECGYSEKEAILIANNLVTTSLFGVDSHGANLLIHYLEKMKDGYYSKQSDMVINKISTCVSKIDGKNAMGHLVADRAVKEAVKNASQMGIGMSSCGNSNHFGAAFIHGFNHFDDRYLIFASTNADALVKPLNYPSPIFGTNPFCLVAPSGSEMPVIIDFATSTFTWNKLKKYENAKIQLPNAVAFDQLGINTLEPSNAVSLAPIAEHKGVALGMAMTILTACIANGPLDFEIPECMIQIN